MKISIDYLNSLLVHSAASFVNSDEAEYFASEQIDTFIKKQPRSGSIKDVISDLKSWKEHPNNKLIIEAEKSASLLINCNALSPSLKLKYIHDEAENKARQNGISLIGINHGGIHTLNLWTDGLGKRDMIAIFMYNGGPNGVIPFGGTRGIFGTNPISYAIPTEKDPIIVDMATSEIPYFEIIDAKKYGKKLKANTAVNKEGKITTNPEDALFDDGASNLLPLGGGYKGYALVLLIEILTGSLVRSFLSTEMNPDYIVEEHGGLLLTIDISSFTDLSKFKNSVSRMCEQVRAQTPCQEIGKITLPGDRSYKKKDQILKQGYVDVDDQIIDQLKKF